MFTSPRTLLDFVLDALTKVEGAQPLRSPHRGSWSDSHADLTPSELDFLPYPPAAAALSDWFYACSPEIPDELPWLDFRYALFADQGKVHMERRYAGKDTALRIRAERDVQPLDVTAQLEAIVIPIIGTDCENLYDPVAHILPSLPEKHLTFMLDHSPMGGSYLRWKTVEEHLTNDTSERLYHLVFALLIEWSLDLGGRAPYDVYYLQWKAGRIHLQCNPDHPSAIPDELLYDTLAAFALPDDIDNAKEPYWILDDLEAEYPELHDAIVQKALKETIAEYTLDMDITDILKGTPNIPWEY